MRAKVLIIGCGDLGCEVARQLKSHGLYPIGLKRTTSHDIGFEVIQADVTQPDSLSALSKINPDFLVYCVAADAQTDESYRAHYVDGLRNVLATLEGANNLKHVFFVSSTRMYGQSGDILLDENTRPAPTDFGGERLLEAEQLLLQSKSTWTHTALRLTGIYGPGRTRMLKLASAPEKWPSDNAWSNRIHRDDAAAFICYLIKLKQDHMAVETCYVVTDSCPVSSYEVLRWIADQMHMAAPKLDLPITGGKKMNNRRMLATGFKLQYPDYKAGYADLLKSYPK